MYVHDAPLPRTIRYYCIIRFRRLSDPVNMLHAVAAGPAEQWPAAAYTPSGCLGGAVVRIRRRVMDRTPGYASPPTSGRCLIRVFARDVPASLAHSRRNVCAVHDNNYGTAPGTRDGYSAGANSSRNESREIVTSGISESRVGREAGSDQTAAGPNRIRVYKGHGAAFFIHRLCVASDANYVAVVHRSRRQ